jgi:hypothetical protein
MMGPKRPTATDRVQLTLLRGGLDVDPPMQEWNEFTARIGWQATGGAPADEGFEDRLALRLFGQMSETPVETSTARRATAWSSGWPLAAAAAVLLLVGATMALWAWPSRMAPPAASTVPTPAPERVVPRQEETTPEADPDPGVRAMPRRHARVEARAAVVTASLRSTRQSDALAVAAPRFSLPHAPVGIDLPAVSPDAEPFAAPALGGAVLASDLLALPSRLRLPFGPSDAHDAGLPASAGPNMPMWSHLGMARADQGRAVAVVDVLDAGRKLRGL